MTKKMFAQPEMMVVNVRNIDIVTASPDAPLGGSQNNDVALGAGLRGLFDPDDSWDTGY